nr:hypothetical protein RVX_1831 [Nitratidesulfovibrio sp. HK-II]
MASLGGVVAGTWLGVGRRCGFRPRGDPSRRRRGAGRCRVTHGRWPVRHRSRGVTAGKADGRPCRARPGDSAPGACYISS